MLFPHILGKNTIINFNELISLGTPPDNENCADAEDASGGSASGTTDCASPDGNFCVASKDHVVYYTYTVAGPGFVSVIIDVTAVTAADIAVEAWTDCGGTDIDPTIDCATSLALTCVPAGTIISIPVGSAAGEGGTFDLSISEIAGNGPVNDTCENAEEILVFSPCEPVSVAGSTSNACPELFSAECGQETDATIWYHVTTLSSTVAIEFTNITGNLQVFTDCPVTTMISACILTDQTINAESSTQYWISATTMGGGDISFDISLRDAAANNNSCSDAIAISSGSATGTTHCASADPNFCNSSSDHVVYFTYTVAGPGSVNVLVDIDKITALDIDIEAWSDCSGIPYQSNSGCENSLVLNGVPEGTTLTIPVGSTNGGEGSFEIDINETPIVPTDLNLVTNGPTECISSLEDGYDNDPSCPDSSVEWFRINTDDSASLLQFEINGNSFTPLVEIRRGTCDGEEVDYEQTDLNFTANVAGNESYYIGVNSSLGAITEFFICATVYLQLAECAGFVELERFRPSNPDADQDGPYCPGETVSFCYQVDFTIGEVGDPDGNNCQWIQGIVPVLGCGWDLESLDIADQAPLGWFWLEEGMVDYNVENPTMAITNTCCGNIGLEYQGGNISPGTELPAGFWFTSPGGSGCTNDGNPDNMWGLPGGCGSSQSVEFCFDLRAKTLQGIECADDCLKDLSVNIFTFADGETGCWSDGACTGDVPIIFEPRADCDTELCGVDEDGDGFGALIDCDDTNPLINPDAEELCDGIDNNCNGIIDEDACNLNTCVGDILFEGGSGSFQNTDSLVTQEFVFDFSDCELMCISLDVSTNGEAWIGPGNLETPDECGFGIGCEGDPFNSTADDCDMCWDFLMAQIFIGDSLVYQNILGDDQQDELEITWNTQLEGADFPDTTQGTIIISGQTFAMAENLSFSNLMVTCLVYFDDDGDGFNSTVDCDDNNANINPDAIEICDGIDNNCDGIIDEGVTVLYYEDLDGDGYGNPLVSQESCAPVAGFSLNNTDCDDTNAGINEGAIEIPNNSIDENCDGMDEVFGDDNDGDGYFGNDCDDTNAAINPGANEICDGIDNNCDGQIDEAILFETYYQDNDGDGYGNPEVSEESCVPLAGYTLNNTDCDDSNAGINEGAVEIPDNGIDEDCDGQDLTTPMDLDNDGFLDDVDCDDGNATIYPGAEELCDGVDNNCDGEIDEGLTFVTYFSDADMDGYGTGEGFTDCILPPDSATEGGDCDDSNPDINPGVEEIANNDIDENCDGDVLIIDNDGDGWNSDLDCDDTNAAINPGAEDLTVNGIDEDCDGIDGPSSTQNTINQTYTFYPNPTNDLIYVDTDNSNLKYELYDIRGMLKANGRVEQEISLRKFNAGVYLMKVIDTQTGDHSFMRIIKI